MGTNKGSGIFVTVAGTIFRGRPRGRSVDSRSNVLAVRVCQGASPNGTLRTTDFDNAFSSAPVCGDSTCCSQPRGNASSGRYASSPCTRCPRLDQRYASACSPPNRRPRSRPACRRSTSSSRPSISPPRRAEDIQVFGFVLPFDLPHWLNWLPWTPFWHELWLFGSRFAILYGAGWPHGTSVGRRRFAPHGGGECAGCVTFFREMTR